MLEWYRTNASYFDIMDDTENLFVSVIKSVLGDSAVKNRIRSINFSPPWTRMTVFEAWQKYTGIDLEKNYTDQALLKEGKRIGVKQLNDDDSRDVLYFKIFLDRIEPHLGKEKPVFLYEYPSDMAALARIKPDNPSVAMRFELYIDGIELGNAFDEVVDPDVQRSRCEEARAIQKSLGKDPFPIDSEFIQALESGLPPSAGIALGVDRMIMLLLNKTRIQDVVAFPFTARKA